MKASASPRRTILLILVSMLGTLAPAGNIPDAAAHGINGYEDCGTYNDTPPAHEMFNGESCTGWLNYDNSDEYSFLPTIDDHITVQFTERSNACMFGHVYGPSGDPFEDTGGFDGGGTERGFAVSRSLVADSNSYFTIKIHRKDTGTSCNYVSGSWKYTIKLTITPNDRPAVSVVSGPTTVEPGQSATYVIGATDVDSNLKRVGMRVGAGPTEWKNVSGGSSSTSFTTSFMNSSTLTFFGEDAYGATGSVSLPVTMVQNDCGSGGDASALAVTAGSTCRGLLSSVVPDHSDSYTFAVAGSDPRVRATYALEAGDLSARLTLTSPTGVSTTVTDGSVFSLSETGTWTALLERIAGSGIYVLGLGTTGAPAAPTVTGSLSDNAPHQGELFTLNFSATDPNGLGLRYSIDWGDGTSEAIPVSPMTFLASGGQQRTHRFLGTATSPTIVVRATNQEGLFSQWSVTPTVKLHDDCAFGATYDAPAAIGTARQIPPVCTADIGFRLPETNFPLDLVDAYKVTLTSYQRMRIALTTSGPVSVRMYVEYLGQQIPALPSGTSGSGQSFELPLAPSGTYNVYVTLLGGRGSYTVTTTKG